MKISVEELKQLIVYFTLVIATFAFIFLGQVDLAEKIIIAFLAIATNNRITEGN